MAGIVVPERARSHLPPFTGPVAAAWVVLLGAHISGSGNLLHHDAVLDSGAVGLTGLTLFLAGWSAMVVAMMIPATWPLGGRPSPAGLGAGPSPAGFLGGFLLVWGVAGAAALALDGGVHRAVHGMPALEARPWLVTAAVLAVAGLAQLLPSTARHLAGAPPLRRVAADPTAGAFSTGRNHGLRCLRADGPLMLVMFATGGALAGMVGFTVVMVAERHPRWGRTVAAAAGGALVAAAALTGLHGV